MRLRRIGNRLRRFHQTGYAGLTVPAPRSGHCLIRGSRFHTASAARQLLATVGPSARPLLE